MLLNAAGIPPPCASAACCPEVRVCTQPQSKAGLNARGYCGVGWGCCKQRLTEPAAPLACDWPLAALAGHLLHTCRHAHSDVRSRDGPSWCGVAVQVTSGEMA